MHGDEFFFTGGGRQEALDALFEGIRHSGVVMLLLGEAGSGRSALVRRFAAEADPDVLAVAVVTGDILMSPGQLLAALRDALGYTPSTQPADDLWRAVHAIRDASRDAVLVVDDAHELGMEARAEILRFAQEADVALVLVGDATLAASMDPQVTVETVALRPLDEEEIDAFVAGWLAVDDEDELPSNRVMARLHRASAGMPGRLAELLAAGAAKREPLLPNGIPPWHLLIGAGAVLLLAGIVVFLLASSPVGEDTAPVEKVVELPHPSAPASATETSSRNGADVAVPRPMEAKVYQPAPKPADMTGGAAGAVAAMPDSAAPANAAPANAAPASAASAPAVPAVPATSAGPAVVAAPPAAAISAPATKPASQPAPAPSRFTADEQALLAEPRSRYTVQLFASFNSEAVHNFRARHQGTDMRVFRTTREDLPWFVAVAGSYRNRDEAKAAVARLPLDLQALKPWARSLQGIHDELRRRGN